MIDQDQSQHDSSLMDEKNRDNQAVPTTKRQFIEPEISQPVDVLEATTFFQALDSGATN